MVATATPVEQLLSVLDEWRPARELADRAGVDRRTAAQRLGVLVRLGYAEMRRVGEAPLPWSDPPPRQYRRWVMGS